MIELQKDPNPNPNPDLLIKSDNTKMGTLTFTLFQANFFSNPSKNCPMVHILCPSFINFCLIGLFSREQLIMPPFAQGYESLYRVKPS